MSANRTWRVKVLLMMEETIEVSAITSDEAKRKAYQNPDVARVLEVIWDIEPGEPTDGK